MRVPKLPKPLRTLSLLLLALMASGVILWMGMRPSATLAFLDVGQGDSIFFRSPEGRTVLVDAGPDASAAAGLNRHLGSLEKTIDLFVLTHPDRDHFEGIFDVMDHYDVKAVMLTGVASDDADFTAFLQRLQREKIPVIRASAERDWRLGREWALDVLYPLEGEPIPEGASKNNTSIVTRIMRLENGAWRPAALLTGDAEFPEEDVILASGTDVRAAILKLGHHGSKGSSSQAWVTATGADTAVVSAGRDNRYGHPSPEALERVKGMAVRSTITEGDIVFRFK